MKKGTLVYFNNESLIDTDLTVLKYFTDSYHVIWYPIIASNSLGYSKTFLKEYARINHIEIHCLEVSWRRRSVKQLLLIMRLIFAIRALRPAIVFTGNRDLYWILGAILFLNLKNIVIGIHDFQLHSGSQLSSFYKISQKILFNCFKNYVFYSEMQQALFRKEYYKKTCCTGMSVKDFGKSSLQPISYDTVKFLFFGRIDSYKGLDLLIKATENLINLGYCSFELSICGRGVFWEKCKSLIKHGNFYNLKIRFVENDEIADLFVSHHYLILPYRETTQSGPLMIAVNYGLPIISPFFDCFKAIYADKESALFYNPDQEKGLESALISAFKMSDSQYQTIRKNVLQIKERHSEQNVAYKYIDFFRSIEEVNKYDRI